MPRIGVRLNRHGRVQNEVVSPEPTAGRRILANTAYRTVADVGSKLASLALYVLMGRKLGAAEFGVFTLGLSIVMLATALGGFGQDVILMREVARRHEEIHRFFANTLVLKLILALPALGLTLGIGLLAGLGREQLLVVGLLGIGVIAELLASTCFAVFQAHERFAYIPIALISERLFTAVVGIVALERGAGVVAISVVYLVGAMLGLALALLLVLRRIVRPRLEVTWRTWWPLMQTAAPVGVAVVFGLVLSRIDTAMLAAFKSKIVVGNYGAAYRLFEAPLLLSFGVTAAVYPVLSRLTRSTVPPVGVIFERAVKLAVALTSPIAVGAAILSGPVIELLYGDSFDAAGGALALLAPALALFPIGYLAAYLLVSQGRQRILSLVYGLVAAENILANVVLIPLFSLKGAALGTSVSQLLQTAALVYYAGQVAGAIDWPRMLGGTVVASVLAGAAMALLRGNLAAAIGVGAAIYVVALLVFEQLVFPQDAGALWNFVRRDLRRHT